MDIIVTLPKQEHKNFEKELPRILNGEFKVWLLHTKPRKLSTEERVYIVKNGQVFASMKVVDIVENSSIQCSTTQREFAAKYLLYLNDYREEEMDIKIRGFRGFRYRDSLLF